VECIKSWDLYPIGFLKAVVSGALAEVVPVKIGMMTTSIGLVRTGISARLAVCGLVQSALPNGYRNETKCLMP
jgi:hypothetical protein